VLPTEIGVLIESVQEQRIAFLAKSGRPATHVIIPVRLEFRSVLEVCGLKAIRGFVDAPVVCII